MNINFSLRALKKDFSDFVFKTQSRELVILAKQKLNVHHILTCKVM